MQKKSARRVLVAAVSITIVFFTYRVFSEHQFDEPDPDMFMMEEAAQDYWLRGGIGYCGAEMQPDFNEVKKAARNGNSIAAFRLGQVYSAGNWGVRKDLREAVNWFRMAAENGHYESTVKMGLAYEFGRGVKQDASQAVEWYWRALKLKGTDKTLEDKIRQLESQ